ncbi:hypothetical protein EGW08_010884 [Elysia chlorotica]|uniref:Uncharacterized protein n=1 Tax=Elysia chlorotica TaxID=188477 RepID=A0A3S1BI84_ELYCH|nr:hypothetical protein EGW08_010884 [Elysia chlorotica]
MDKDAYKRLWEQQNSQRGAPVERAAAGRNKKDRNVPVQRLDTDALIAEVLAEKLEEENRKLRQERQQLEAAKHPEGSRHLTRQALDSPGGLPVGGYEDHRRKLEEERRQEYLELQRQKASQQAWGNKPGASSEGLLIRADPGQERLQQLKEERNKEYNELLAKKRKMPTPERYGLPRDVDEAEDFGLLHNLGARDREMPRQGDPPASQLNLSGHGVMDNAIRRGYQGRPLREQTDEYKAAAIGSNESDAAKRIPALIASPEPRGPTNSILLQQRRSKWQDINIKPYSQCQDYVTDVSMMPLQTDIGVK